MCCFFYGKYIHIGGKNDWIFWMGHTSYSLGKTKQIGIFGWKIRKEMGRSSSEDRENGGENDGMKASMENGYKFQHQQKKSDVLLFVSCSDSINTWLYPIFRSPQPNRGCWRWLSPLVPAAISPCPGACGHRARPVDHPGR